MLHLLHAEWLEHLVVRINLIATKAVVDVILINR
jgi:hypothetical protein